MATVITTLVLVVCVVTLGLTPTAFLLLIPAAGIVFAGGLVGGHVLAKPLRTLIRKSKLFANGIEVAFIPDGSLQETDELTEIIGVLVKRSKSKEADLVRRTKRQNEFVSDVAHELRTPLAAIRGNAEILMDPDLPAELQEKFGGIIISESDRLTRLVNDLLTLHHIESDKTIPEMLTRINLRDVAQEVLDALHSVLNAQQANVKIVGEAPDVLGNRDRLKEALTNLVANASRFIKPGGHITIDLCGLRGNSVIQIRDDGSGFGDIDPSLLFERFYRTDSSRARNTGGSGLGLAIVKSIVEEHDGMIEAINRPEGGACFIMAIPSIAEVADEATEAHEAPHEP